MDDAHDDPLGLTGTTLRGRYAVGPVVARGGFGTVYRARSLDLDAPVALKVLHGAERLPDATREESVAQFRREARTLAALNHPALARVIEFGTLPRGGREVPWMALDWIDGPTLEDDLRARDGRGRSPREALDLLRPAFEALACAHEAGVSHRDIKPSNLMIVRARRGEPALRVIDFGVAKADPSRPDAVSGATATRSEAPAFSALYAAPEQVSRTRTGPWTDVHALALVLTEVLVGRRAYRGEDGPALVLETVDPRRPTPERHGVTVGPWEAVIERALAVAPGDRQVGAAMLLRELEASVSEAQAAWETSSPHGHGPRAPSLAETETRAPPTPVITGVTPPVRAPAFARPALLFALAAVALAVALVVVPRSRTSGPPPRPSLPAVNVADASPARGPLHEPAVRATAPDAAVAPSPEVPVVARPVARPSPSRIARTRTLLRGAQSAAPVSPAVPFVAIE